MGARHSVTIEVPGDADEVFDLVIDVDRLPDWNAAMKRVVERPAVLVPGSEWVVEFQALGRTWLSRSRVEELDRHGRVFAYRAATDDGNPSYARWRWQVEPDARGSTVTIGWDLHPQTFWRRVLLARVRHRQLRRTEVPASLDALARVLTPAG